MSEVLLSQLAYAELVSPKPDETVAWLVDVLGLEETTREGQSVYLRGFAEWLHSSLIVTEGPEPALGRIGWRAYGPEDPEIIAKRVEGEWVGERPGRGVAYAYRAAGRAAPARGLLGDRALRGADREAGARSAVPPAEVPGARRTGALHRPRDDRDAVDRRRHRVLQDARCAPHRADPARSPASTSSRR